MPMPFRSTGSGLLIITGDTVFGQDNASGAGGDLPIKGGDSTGGAGDGGDVIITPGAGNGIGNDGIVNINGVKNYPTGAVDPTDPAPADGDMYYNSTLDMAMRYDGTRAKWLSVEVGTFLGSDATGLAPGTYFQLGNVRMTATLGITANFNGTVVGLAYTRTDSDAASFAVTDAGATIASLASSAVSGNTTSFNANFSQGAILGMRNDGVNALSNGIVYMRVKWRA